MRRWLNQSLLATDATPTSEGSVRASCAPELIEELWRRSEVRAAIRMDREHDLLHQAELPFETSKFASVVSECLDWSVTGSFAFRKTAHINLQEARALRAVIKLAGDFQNGGCVQVALNDSMVVVGAFAKGRSSACCLNGIMRSLLPFMIFGDIVLALIWVETESNAADYPSRFKANAVVRKCPGSHQHGPPLRGVRAKRAGAYPWKFCHRLGDEIINWGKRV